MSRIFLLFLVFAFVGMMSCHSSKHYYKTGTKQEQGGLVNEAAESYYIALQRKRTNVDAQIGMKRTGQLVLNNLLNDFSKQKNFGDYKSAVYSFHQARNYRDRIQSVGVSLLLSDIYEKDYQDSKSIYLKSLYDEGNQLLQDKKFTEAEKRFTEIKQIDPAYKDAGDLGDVAYLEPLYQQGKLAMALEHYREAYEFFEKVIARKSSYKEVTVLRRECLEKGKFTIALVDFKNTSGIPGMEAKIAAYTLDALTSSQDPFINVVDRDNLQNILNEQHLQMTGIMDETTAVTVGELVGAKAILTGTVLSYSEKKGTLRSKQRDGYLSYQERVLNRTDGKYYMQTLYRPVSYTEYYNSNACTVSFQYKVTNIKTGEIIATEIIEKTLNDEVIYGRFDGDVNTLWPAGQGGPNMNQNDKRALLAMMNARQEVKTSGELSNTLFNQLSTQMTGAIEKAIKEIVK
jgi:curli biogenesis system outer membrane secretion channel CsgG